MTPAAKTIRVQRLFLEDLHYFVETNPRLALRVLTIVQQTSRDPSTGIGKPERLRHLGPDYWSRRVDKEHRIVYRVYEDTVDFVQCRFHYQR